MHRKHSVRESALVTFDHGSITLTVICRRSDKRSVVDKRSLEGMALSLLAGHANGLIHASKIVREDFAQKIANSPPGVTTHTQSRSTTFGTQHVDVEVRIVIEREVTALLLFLLAEAVLEDFSLSVKRLLASVEEQMQTFNSMVAELLKDEPDNPHG